MAAALEPESDAGRPLDPSLFDPPLDDDFVCSICTNALYRPISLTCPHLFCQRCVKKQMEIKGEEKKFDCPCCRNVTDIDVGERGINAKINQIINGKLKINCPNKCGTKLDCLGTNPERGRLLDHLKNECTHQEIECEQCKDKMQRMALVDHKSNKCSERMVECDYCKKKMTEKNRMDHLNRSEGNDEKKSSAAVTPSSFSVSITGCNNRSYCKNKENGCKWIGLNEQLNDHNNQCGRGIISCTICDKKIFRELLSSHNKDTAEMHSMIQIVKRQLEKQFSPNGLTCTLSYALPTNSIQSGKHFDGKVVSLTDSLKIKLHIVVDEKENVGLSLQNESSHQILATSIIGQLWQWKNNKLILAKEWTLANQPIGSSTGWGWLTFVTAKNWKDASPLDDCTSSLPSSDSTERKVFDIAEADGASNGKYLLFIIKATVASINLNGRIETNYSLIKTLNDQ